MDEESGYRRRRVCSSSLSLPCDVEGRVPLGDDAVEVAELKSRPNMAAVLNGERKLIKEFRCQDLTPDCNRHDCHCGWSWEEDGDGIATGERGRESEGTRAERHDQSPCVVCGFGREGKGSGPRD